jgi:hypothetical protein
LVESVATSCRYNYLVEIEARHTNRSVGK